MGYIFFFLFVMDLSLIVHIFLLFEKFVAQKIKSLLISLQTICLIVTEIVTDLETVTICDGNCDGLFLFVMEWQVHRGRKKFVTEILKFFTENPVTIKTYVKYCDRSVTIPDLLFWVNKLKR